MCRRVYMRVEWIRVAFKIMFERTSHRLRNKSSIEYINTYEHEEKSRLLYYLVQPLNMKKTPGSPRAMCTLFIYLYFLYINQFLGIAQSYSRNRGSSVATMVYTVHVYQLICLGQRYEDLQIACTR